MGRKLSASLNVGTGSVFDGGDAAITIDALNGVGTFQGAGGGVPVTPTIGVADGSGTFSGTIQDDSGGSLAIVKTGAGTQTFSGADSYSDGTQVADGTLRSKAPTRCPATFPVWSRSPTAQRGGCGRRDGRLATNEYRRPCANVAFNFGPRWGSTPAMAPSSTRATSPIPAFRCLLSNWATTC